MTELSCSNFKSVMLHDCQRWCSDVLVIHVHRLACTLFPCRNYDVLLGGMSINVQQLRRPGFRRQRTAYTRDQTEGSFPCGYPARYLPDDETLYGVLLYLIQFCFKNWKGGRAYCGGTRIRSVTPELESAGMAPSLLRKRGNWSGFRSGDLLTQHGVSIDRGPD